VPEAVVHALEVVEVGEHQSEGVADPLGTAPLERELVIEGTAVCKAGQPVGRRLRGNPAEVAQRVEDRPRKQEGDEHEQCEGSERRIEHPLLVGADAARDRLLGPQGEQADADGVRHTRDQPPIALTIHGDRSAFDPDPLTGSDDSPAADYQQPVVSAVCRGAAKARCQTMVQRNGRHDGSNPLCVDRQRDRATERVARTLARDELLVQIEEHPRGRGSEAADRGSVACDEGVLERRRLGEVVGSVRGIVGELAELLACSLKLAAESAVSSGAFILERVRVEDVDGRDDGNHPDDEHADEKL
jgi:hypothetical protein